LPVGERIRIKKQKWKGGETPTLRGKENFPRGIHPRAVGNSLSDLTLIVNHDVPGSSGKNHGTEAEKVIFGDLKSPNRKKSELTKPTLYYDKYFFFGEKPPVE